MGKWELTMNPVQEWGEEIEDGAVFGITLRREPVQQSSEATESCPCSAFVQYRTCKVRRLKAATLERLVAHLLDPCCQEQDYGRILLSTYCTFTSSNELIEMLFQRDILASELDNNKCHKSPLWTLLQIWLEEFAEDFRDSPMHSSLRLMCLQLRRHPSLSPLAKRYEALLKRFQAEDLVNNEQAGLDDEPEVDQEEKDLETDDLTNQAEFMDFTITGLAEQLTRLDAELFVKVVPFQCLGCVWSQRDKKENLSPTIRATIAQFNAITNRVITSLLCPSICPSSTPLSSTTQRARIIEKWIRVAQECRQLKNFSSLRAILSALQSNPIYRLRKTWASVSRESLSIFENLCETFPDENCVLTSREILVEDGGQAAVDNISPSTSKRCPVSRQMSTTSGVVPYLGTYLTVLTMLDTALPDTVECGLINFEKRRREYEILWQIRQLQASCSQYVLPHHPQIAAWLQRHRLLTDQESYELSRQLEPPLDTCPPSSSGAWSHRALTRKLSSLLSVSDGSRRNADQISVSSSGSSSSEMEDLSTHHSSPLRAQSLSSSCQNMADSLPSSSSPDSSCSSSGSPTDLILPPPPSSSTPTKLSHKRSVSMTSLPLYNRQVADSCIIRVSVERSNNGNMYKSILLTSQDKTAQVIERALQKHNLENASVQDFSLVQVLAQDRELLIPDKANVYYAMSTSANYDFVLRHYPKGQRKQLTRSVSMSAGRCSK
ncbi:ral guanine nucleotide dissociation stimulator-like 1 isoform X1 [Colossoma macropomum]|uniref:ral guanine nucleotide dissociation stimulator-like 1 isoform X1 n=1 Tax=Colossoma macropomum TaxID=42526 RepID=UPI001864A856|nr:ral guanine nucleotide dissociation stimulator-like 1 isoform X1 [Colossoma macropomum]